MHASGAALRMGVWACMPASMKAGHGAATAVATCVIALVACATRPSSSSVESAPTTTTTLPQSGYTPCVDGPPTLKMVDDAERAGTPPIITDYGRPSSPEALAERYIADCSANLSTLLIASAVVRRDGSVGRATAAIAASWQQNLQY